MGNLRIIKQPGEEEESEDGFPIADLFCKTSNFR